MKIEYLQGDLFQLAEEHKIKYIAHGCNCQGVMGAGVALQIRNKFPSVYREYQLYCEHNKGSLLGMIEVVPVFEVDIAIINCFTQDLYGRESFLVKYGAILECMKRINSHVPEGSKVIMPKIGAGLGGGNWEIISKIIEEESSSFQPVVAVL